MADELLTQTPDAPATVAPDTAAQTVTDAPAQSTTPAPVDTAPTETPSPKFLGRFHTAEQLEAYAQGLEKSQQGRVGQAPPQTTTPEQKPPTVEQLRYSKSHWLREVTRAQIAGDEGTAEKALANLNWCDDQLMDARLSQESKKWQGQSAVDSLMREGDELLKPYQNDLQPGNPLFETANQYFNQIKTAIDSGISPDRIISGLAVLAAAQKTGKTTAGVKQAATKDFSEALQKAAKQAVVTGGGAATKTATGKPDYAAMSDAEFAKHEKAILEQSQSVPWSRDKRF